MSDISNIIPIFSPSPSVYIIYGLSITYLLTSFFTDKYDDSKFFYQHLYNPFVLMGPLRPFPSLLISSRKMVKYSLDFKERHIPFRNVYFERWLKRIVISSFMVHKRKGRRKRRPHTSVGKVSQRGRDLRR